MSEYQFQKLLRAVEAAANNVAIIGMAMVLTLIGISCRIGG